MTTATIKSQTSNAEYTLYFDSKKKAVGCSCPSKKFNPSQCCKHMNAANTPAPVVEHRNTCILCGHDTRNTICGRCTE